MLSRNAHAVFAVLLSATVTMVVGTAPANAEPSDDSEEVESGRADTTDALESAARKDDEEGGDEDETTAEASDDDNEEEGNEDETSDEDEFDVQLHGAYSIWGLTQNNFFLGRDHTLDDAKYVVQNFRLKMKAGQKNVGGVLRADFAQSWWGADNKPNVDRTARQDEDGNLEQSDQYNPYAYFRKKGTAYDIHVDHAYIYFKVPEVPLKLRLGREHHAVGNKLVLDQDLDGIKAIGKPSDSVSLQASWAKVSEGFQSFKNPAGGLMSDEGKWSDANLYGLQVNYDNETFGGQLFALHYQDNIPDWDYYPQGLGYFHSRFQPQVSQASAFGLKLDGELPVGAGLTYNAEFDYLIGADDLDNDTYAGNLIDKNNGTLNGYNAYLDVTQTFDVGFPMDLGLTLGRGSGDADPTGGPGNLNRIQTQGFFSLTNVWEDSVMPDIGGITPQGLGSPASRGYRELSNTTAAQVSAGFEPLDDLRVEGSYTYLTASQPIHGWDENGPTDETASDIGQEIDLNLKWNIYKNLKAVTLGGIFLPGQGASLLINGERGHLDPAWEVKQVLLYKFQAL